MSDLIKREDAMGAVQDHFNANGFKGYDDGQKMMDRIKALPSAEAKGDLISREDALEQMAQAECGLHYEDCEADNCSCSYIQRILDIPSAEAVQGWRTGEPTESGKYMVTLDAWGRRYIDIMYYGKPQMPNYKVRGMCWYKADHEYGDVVYDDEDILAWMPLPMPYREDGE